MALPLPPVQLKNNYAGWFLALWNYLVGLVKAFANQQPPTYRAVITTIAIFNGSGTGTLTAAAPAAIGVQDSTVTLAAGDRVFLPAKTGGAAGAAIAPADWGPYIVVNPGSGSVAWVITRPPEFAHGSLIPECFTVKIGEGTIWAGNEWRAFPINASQIVDTNTPAFWPRTFSATVVEAAGSLSTWWIKDVNKVSACSVSGGSGAAHPFFISTLTPGIPGTSALVITGTGSDIYATMAVNF